MVGGAWWEVQGERWEVYSEVGCVLVIDSGWIQTEGEEEEGEEGGGWSGCWGWGQQ